MNDESAINSLKEKIDNLNRQAWDTRVTDSPRALSLSKESVALSRTINYDNGLAFGLLVLGFCNARFSKNDEALSVLNESIELFRSKNDFRNMAVAYEYLAVTHRNLGDLGVALELLFKSEAINEEHGITERSPSMHYQFGVNYKHLGDFEKALEYFFRGLKETRDLNHELFISYYINIIGSLYFDNGDYEKALDYYEQGLAFRKQLPDKWAEAGSLDNVGFTYFKLKDYEQASSYCRQSLEISRASGDLRGQANALLHLAEISKQKNDLESAEKYAEESLGIRKSGGEKRGQVEIYLFMAGLFESDQKLQSKVNKYLLQALKIAEELQATDMLSRTHFQLYKYTKRENKLDEAIHHLEIHQGHERELNKNAINQKMISLEISHKAEQTKKEADIIRQRNEELTKLNNEVEEQKKKLEAALDHLKATQVQLIQSEKMASLGELTAGIAHEIQNPLNFVNNFSDINSELIKEMQEEMEKGNISEAKAISDDIKANEEKISHHGKRADAIVKGMLQHSRSSSGEKEMIGINALCDEYLRLAYHGIRAKDKLFNAEIITDFDKGIEKINVVPQDIGRVVLNLINNAFYAVSEKAKQNIAGFNPTVTISTKKLNDKIEISVKDNGNGIPDAIKEKIFQPFFTTKPTGQGTGLGLSLSYDIITKGHGGELKAASNENKGTTFIISIPTN